MPLDARDAAALERLVGECRRLFELRLLAVALYGEAATEAYRPRESPLHTVVLLDRVRAPDLAALRDHVPAWHRLGLGTPLVIDRDYLATSRDVFPLELLDLADRHRVLHGTDDPFAALAPARPEHLRLEVEEQVKGKLLHLREGYLAVGRGGAELERLVRASLVSFDLLLRGLLALAGVARPEAPDAVVAAAEAAYRIPLPTLARLARWQRGAAAVPRRDLEAVFAAYHDEVVALASCVDAR